MHVHVAYLYMTSSTCLVCTLGILSPATLIILEQLLHLFLSLLHTGHACVTDLKPLFRYREVNEPSTRIIFFSGFSGSFNIKVICYQLELGK